MAGLDDFMGLIHNFMSGRGFTSQPQAYSRTTRTPMYWGTPSWGEPDYSGKYTPIDRTIQINQNEFPQTNPDLTKMDPIVRHEEVHALLDRTGVEPKIGQYLQQNPQIQQAGEQGLAQYPGYRKSDLKYEAPAYAAEGESLGMPVSAVQAFHDRMPPNIQKTYRSLLPPGSLIGQ